MASRKGNPVHGWVILDKPEGLSSSRAVGIVRRVFNAACLLYTSDAADD